MQSDVDLNGQKQMVQSAVKSLEISVIMLLILAIVISMQVPEEFWRWNAMRNTVFAPDFSLIQFHSITPEMSLEEIEPLLGNPFIENDIGSGFCRKYSRPKKMGLLNEYYSVTVCTNRSENLIIKSFIRMPS